MENPFQWNAQVFPIMSMAEFIQNVLILFYFKNLRLTFLVYVVTLRPVIGGKVTKVIEPQSCRSC